MRAWRLCLQKHAATALGGVGAALKGGRWNPPGDAVAYCAESLALATLEVLVNVQPNTIPDSYVSVEIDIPDDLSIERYEDDDPGRLLWFVSDLSWTRDLGHRWLVSGASAVLTVPSIVIPPERNVLINPAHPDTSRIRVVAIKPFLFDPRLWRLSP